jgi:hypothetical protein
MHAHFLLYSILLSIDLMRLLFFSSLDNDRGVYFGRLFELGDVRMCQDIVPENNERKGEKSGTP